MVTPLNVNTPHVGACRVMRPRIMFVQYKAVGLYHNDDVTSRSLICCFYFWSRSQILKVSLVQYVAVDTTHMVPLAKGQGRFLIEMVREFPDMATLLRFFSPINISLKSALFVWIGAGMVAKRQQIDQKAGEHGQI